MHRGRPVHHLHLRVDADRLQLLLHHQRRVVHRRIVLVGQQHDRLALVAGLRQILLRQRRVVDVVGFLAGIGVVGLVRILEADVQLVVAVRRGIHDLVHVQRRLHRLAEHQIVGRRHRDVRMRDLDPPVLQRQDRDVLVVLQIRQRLGRQVLDALQLAGLQAGDARRGSVTMRKVTVSKQACL